MALVVDWAKLADLFRGLDKAVLAVVLIRKRQVGGAMKLFPRRQFRNGLEISGVLFVFSLWFFPFSSFVSLLFLCVAFVLL